VPLHTTHLIPQPGVFFHSDQASSLGLPSPEKCSPPFFSCPYASTASSTVPALALCAGAGIPGPAGRPQPEPLWVQQRAAARRSEQLVTAPQQSQFPRL